MFVRGGGGICQDMMNIKNHERNSLKIGFYFFKASCGGGAFSIDNDNTILVLP